MVAIAPFRALRYAPSVDLGKVTSPPHDCIPDPEAQRFLEHPHGIAHVVLAKRQGGDAVETAARHLAEWERSGVLVRDAKPALYLYEVTARRPDGRLGTMRGLLCRLALDPDYEHVKRHEKTLPRKKKERYALREAIACDPEPIWLLYRDERAWIEEILTSNAFEEVADFVDEAGEHHRLFRIDRDEAVQEVMAQFDDKDLVIADGHHRYQTAIDHHQATGEPGHGSILACLVREDDPGLGLAATHRLIQGLGMGLEEAVARATHWTAMSIPLPDSDDTTLARQLLAHVERETTSVAVLGKTEAGLRAFHLRLHADATVDHDRGTLDRLVVTRVHERLLHDAWGLDPERPEDHLEFSRDTEATIRAVRDGSAELAVLMPAEEVHDVLAVAEEGHVMPQKSTYFVPKLRSGLVLSPLDEPVPTGWSGQVTDPGKADFRMPPV